ncbi:phage portal protein [Eubacterium limosum]|uniref:phage portal protein n=1 Tax=Eubacterium limosum TaxID=1736 RepID=UPI001062947F|nr:phage portal protein [Eubacterium limosum]
MLSTIQQWASKIIDELIPSNKGSSVLALSPKMEMAIETWASLYANRPTWQSKKEMIFTMGLPGAVANEMARLVTIELKSEITGSQRADFLNEIYKEKVLKNIRQYVEYGCAKGGLIMKPYFNGKGISVDFIQADAFLPVSFDSAKQITAAIFVASIRKGKKIYTRFEAHSVTNSGYTIINKAYLSENDGILGKQVPLSAVEEWAALVDKIVFPYIEKPLFGYFNVPMANRIDDASPLGVSVFSNATTSNLFEIADKQFSRIIQEYKIKEAAIFAAESMFKTVDGKAKLPGGMEKIYRILDLQTGIKDKPFFETFSPEIRDSSLFNGLNKYMQRIEFECGLAYGTISDIQMVEKTAEEIKTSKQRSYSTVSDIQKALKTALEDLVEAMNQLATLYRLTPEGEYKTSFNFDDSIIVDTKTEQTIRMQEVAAGILKPVEYLKWRYGVDDKQAAAMMPDTEDTIDQGVPVDDPKTGGPKANENEKVKEVEEIAGKSLNGAQTQSLIGIIRQYGEGSLTIGQAINLIAVAIGISKEEAKKIIEGAE